jgi:hypothetical protein
VLQKFLAGKSLNKCFKNLKSDVFLGYQVTELCHFDTSRLKQLGKHLCSVFFCQLFDIEGLGKNISTISLIFTLKNGFS